MKVTNLNDIFRGDTWERVLTLTRNSVAIDLTGATIHFTAKEDITDEDTDAAISKAVTSHTNPTGGITSIKLEPEDTNVEPGMYSYDIQLQDASGNISTIAFGKFKILSRVNKDIT